MRNREKVTNKPSKFTIQPKIKELEEELKELIEEADNEYITVNVNPMITPIQNCAPFGKKPQKRPRTYTPTKMAEMLPAITPSDNEDFDDLRESFKLIRNDEKTNVFMVVVDKENSDENILTHLRCNGGIAIGGYAHDLSQDVYIIQCVYCCQIGQIPFSFKLTMENIGNWNARIPIPKTIIEKHLSPDQRKSIEEYQIRYPTPRYSIDYIQMLGCM